MRLLYRILILSLLLVLAVFFGSLGSMNGMAVFIVLAVLFEGAFWFGLFKTMKRDARP
ncbi:MAG: hypothetical protein DHS20C12_21970 [Pseudohongiella sp.]|nr:MAG: hypothetical protein DHS20C12_21970 [Pseudohongiella sp.]